MEYLIALDVGTTSMKTCLFDRSLTLVASHGEEYRLLTPAADIVEMEPDGYWRMTVAGIRAVLARSEVSTRDVKAVVATTQGETLIPVNKEGTPLCNALVWLDTRAGEQAKQLNRKFSGEFLHRTMGLSAFESISPISKLCWLAEHRPDLVERTHKFLLLEDFLIFRLCGRFVTEPSLASSSRYFDLPGNRIWAELLEQTGIAPGTAAEPVECGTVVGALTPVAAEETGLTDETVVVTGAMDQICAAIGAGNIAPGTLSETTGTALVVAATAGPEALASGITVYRHYRKDLYLLLPYANTAGIILKWFRDEFCTALEGGSASEELPPYEELSAMAAEVEPGAHGVMLVPDFTEGKGLIAGLSLGTTRKHVVRAIMESVGYLLRSYVGEVEETGQEYKAIRSMGGGSRSPEWARIKADIVGRELLVMQQAESASLGAAMLAATALQWFADLSHACDAAVHVKHTVAPDPERSRRYQPLYEHFMQWTHALGSMP